MNYQQNIKLKIFTYYCYLTSFLIAGLQVWECTVYSFIFLYYNCNDFADHLQAGWGLPVVHGPHVKKPCPRRPILPSLMWLKYHSTLRCLQGFNRVLSPEESPGLCHVPEKASAV